MKKNISFLRIFLVVVFVLVFCNITYILITNLKFFSINKTSSHKAISWETYNNSKIGFKVEYPPFWVIKDKGDLVEINPSTEEVNTYFSVGLREDFKSLDDIKKTLATNIPIIPIQISNASGFKYIDSDYHEINWLLHSDKIYIIRRYMSNDTAKKIFSSFKFID